MANKKISDFTAATTLASGDLFEIETAGGNSRKMTATNVRKPLLTILERSTSQSISNSTDTDASWDTTALQDDVTAFSSGSPTLLTTPSGYTWVRFNFFCNWASNSTGARIYQFKKNGTTMFATQVQAMFESCALLSSRWLPTVATDAWKVTLNQQSGGSLNFNGNTGYGRSSWQAEWRA